MHNNFLQHKVALKKLAWFAGGLEKVQILSWTKSKMDNYFENNKLVDEVSLSLKGTGHYWYQTIGK